MIDYFYLKILFPYEIYSSIFVNHEFYCSEIKVKINNYYALNLRFLIGQVKFIYVFIAHISSMYTIYKL